MRQSIGRLAVLALAAWTSSCTDHQPDQSTTPAPVRIELVAIKQGPNVPTATFRVVNNSGRALAYQGNSAGTPVYRLGLQSEGRWVERAPDGVATSQKVCTLEPGAGVSFEVRAPIPYLSMCVGVGTWEPGGGDLPELVDWHWTWSSTVVFDDGRNPSGG